jgi:CheY-like chemotaxis protein
VGSDAFTVLLVEDELADAALFQEMLADVSPEITVEHVEHGGEALQYLLGKAPYAGRPRPNLVVLDLNMPVMDGHEFLREVKAHEHLRALPVLVLSTSDHPQDVQRSYLGFASGYVVKPGTYAEYTRVLTAVESYWRGVLRLPTIGELVGEERP